MIFGSGSPGDEVMATMGSDVQRQQHQQHREEASTVHRLVQTTHQQHAQLRSLELQLNHSNLQVQALSVREQELRQQVDVLQFTIASSEQDKLLLESKLHDVAGFEGSRRGGGSNCSLSLKDIRGKLLHVANTKIEELTRALQQSQKQFDEAKAGEEQEKRLLSVENQALREEVTRIGQELGKRTVLYSAQERRYHDVSRTYGSLTTEKETENIQLRARLQQLEQQYEKSDRAHIEAMLVSRQLEETNKRLQVQLSDAADRVRTLDSEVADLSSQNVSLHSTVERLRGADLVDLERDLMTEVETIRAESKLREEAMRRQLDTAQEILASEAERREQLIEEVESLRTELTEQSNVLREANSKGLIRLPTGFASSAFSGSTVQPQDFDTVSSSELQLDASLIEACPEGHKKFAGGKGDVNKSADNSIFAAMFGTLDGAGLATDSDWGNLSTHRDEQDEDEGRVRTGAHRYSLESDVGDDETESRGQVHSKNLAEKVTDLHLPLMAASSLQTIKALLEEWFSVCSGSTTSSRPLCVVATERDKQLCSLLMKISKAGSNEQQLQSHDLWKDARKLTIESIQSSNSLDPTVKRTTLDPSTLWDDVTSLLLHILRSVSDKHTLYVMQSQKQPTIPISVRGSHQSSNLSKNFLTGGADSEDGGTAESSLISSNTSHHAPSNAEGHLREELTCLKEELVQRNRREAKLRAAFKEQGTKLALVLKRASELSVPLPVRSSGGSSSSSLQHSQSHDSNQTAVAEAQYKQQLAQQSDLVSRLQSEAGVLREQLDGFREELACTEKQAESNRQLGFAEAAELYSSSIRSLEAELKQVKASLEQAQAQAHEKIQVPVLADSDSQTEESWTNSQHDVANDEEEKLTLRSQVRTLKQALLDNYKELEALQSAFRIQPGATLYASDDSSSQSSSSQKRKAAGERSSAGELDASTQTTENADSAEHQSTSFCTAAVDLAGGDAWEDSIDEDTRARRLLEETLRSHLELWDARAESWTVEQTMILKKLEEAQQSLVQLAAKHEEEKREALLALERNMEDEHGEALVSLQKHHSEEVKALIARMHKDHNEALVAATEAMQLQLQRLIASLSQDHQEELQRVSKAAELSLSMISARDASTTAEASTVTDTDISGATESERLKDKYETRILELRHNHETELSASLSRLERELCAAHVKECGVLQDDRRELELQHEEEKRALISKYRGRLKQQQAEFLAERDQIMSLVKQEYAETCALVEQSVRSSLDLDRDHEWDRESEDVDNSFVIYPEMLSPEVTAGLMGIVGRARGSDAAESLLAASTESESFARLIVKDSSFVVGRTPAAKASNAQRVARGAAGRSGDRAVVSGASVKGGSAGGQTTRGAKKMQTTARGFR